MTQHRYHTNVFWSAEDEFWIADASDLKSCAAFADSSEQAIAAARPMVEAWLETARSDGLPNPGPRDRSAICAAA